MTEKKLTPMMDQYFSIKNRYPDCLLFYRLGDFYELFYDDALIASKELEITLTKRDAGNNDRAPMCGVPHHVAESYISKLVKRGYKVAICDQLEDPRKAKGVVKRGVTRIVTPGTLTDTDNLDKEKNNFLASLYIERKKVGLSYVDLTTGEIYCEIINIRNRYDSSLLSDEIAKIMPSEILVNREDLYMDRLKLMSEKNEIYINNISDSFKGNYDADDLIREHLPEVDLPEYAPSVIKKSLGQILRNIYRFKDENLSHLNQVHFVNTDRFMALDSSTRENLELSSRKGEKEATLLSILDYTKCPMGARMLNRYLEEPLRDLDQINKRLDKVQAFYQDPETLEEVSYYLDRLSDIERLTGKVSLGNANARDLVSLKESFKQIPPIKDILKKSGNKTFDTYQVMDGLEDLYDLIDRAIVDDPPIVITEGEIIKEGYSQKLDSLRSGSVEGRKDLLEYEETEKERTGIKNLRIIYNKKQGYAIEVTKAQVDKVPVEYVRKQTLKNAERYISEELNKIQDMIFGNEQESMDMELDIFHDIRNKLIYNVEKIQKTSRKLAELDCFQSLAKAAMENNYVRPNFNDSGDIKIKGGRHPVVERSLKDGEFIPNDSYMVMKEKPIQIITGPNMAGKSTYMRQVALIQIMAQMGSFVPADSCDLPIVDQIFTRIGASDDLASGDSTFMVEMKEVSNIIKNAKEDSLIILDEVGRGTSTNDGLSIAWALVEFLDSKLPAKTLFATHYHELTALGDRLDKVENLKVDIKESGDRLIFLRKIVPGKADRSYGIEVARMAGFPENIIGRAYHILNNLEEKKGKEINIKEADFSRKETIERLEAKIDSYEYIFEQLQDIDIDNITPLEALSILNDIIKEVKDGHKET